MTTPETITTKLIERNLTITFMESCTSGLLASMFTDTAGASAVFKGSLVTYSNEMKIAAGVPSETIERFGVYSSECARAMAETAGKIYGSDVAVAITGTTGNADPANAGSVLGKAFFCIVACGEIYDFIIEENVSALSRKEIKQLYADRVYGELEKILKQI